MIRLLAFFYFISAIPVVADEYFVRLNGDISNCKESYLDVVDKRNRNVANFTLKYFEVVIRDSTFKHKLGVACFNRTLGDDVCKLIKSAKRGDLIRVENIHGMFGGQDNIIRDTTIFVMN